MDEDEDREEEVGETLASQGIDPADVGPEEQAGLGEDIGGEQNEEESQEG